MIDDTASARAAIVAALEIVLPGRVFAQPPTTRRYVTPSIFVEQHELATFGTAVVAAFPVWIIVDGTIDAQVAALDDLCWNSWLALAPVADSLSQRTATLAGLRAAVIDAQMTIDVATLCGLPAPQAVAIPRESIR